MARRTHLSLVVLLATLLPVAGCGATIEPAGTATTPTAATEAQTTLPPTLERTPQTLSVSVTGVTDHLGHELAGILYEGGELNDLDADALGGLWAVIDTDDFTTTETVRTPATDHTGRFPFVTDTALTVEPGTYTLVIWVDHSLGGVKRWVPVNTDGRGLYGCHLAIDVGTEPNTTITVPANLQPDGWNVDCITGATTPNTDAAAAVAP